MTTPDTLSEDIQGALEELCDQGCEAMDEEEFQEAAMFFTQALALLPAPAEEWDPYGWLQAALGDAYYGMGDHAAALTCFQNAYGFAGPDAVSPFVLRRLRQCQQYLDNEEKAAQYRTGARRLVKDTPRS